MRQQFTRICARLTINSLLVMGASATVAYWLHHHMSSYATVIPQSRESYWRREDMGLSDKYTSSMVEFDSMSDISERRREQIRRFGDLSSHPGDLDKKAPNITYYQQIVPKNQSGQTPKRTLFFLGGNAFTFRESFSGKFCQKLLDATANMQVFILNAPLAPEYPFPAAHDKSLEMLKYLLKNAERFGIDRDDFHVMGYSSGGGIALYVSRELAYSGEMPKSLIMISPFLNFNKSWHTILFSEYRDQKSLRPSFLKAIIDAYTEGENTDPCDPKLSPVFYEPEDLKLLPPTVVIIGRNDYVTSDCRTLVKKMNNSGCYVTLIEVDDSTGLGHGALYKMTEGILSIIVGHFQEVNKAHSGPEFAFYGQEVSKDEEGAHDFQR